MQVEQRTRALMSPSVFARTLRNLSFSDARFDSRPLPLAKLLYMMPTTIATLERLAQEGDTDDRSWARELLLMFGGDKGYDNLVSCAVVCDAMLVGQGFLREQDKAEEDISLSVMQAATILTTLRRMLKDGCI